MDEENNFDLDSSPDNGLSYTTVSSSESNEYEQQQLEQANEKIFENGSNESRRVSFNELEQQQQQQQQQQKQQLTDSTESTLIQQLTLESNDLSDREYKVDEGEENDLNDDKWKNQEKHVFILSEAGKPIYTLHGNEVNLIGFMGMLQALVSIIECGGGDDHLKCVKSGEHTIVFMHKDHLIFVSVSRETDKCVEQLQAELNYIHSQIVSVITLSLIRKIFTAQSNYDLRKKLCGTEKLIGNMIKRVHGDYGMLLNCISSLPMDSKVREQVANLIHSKIQSNSINYILFAILFYEQKLVAIIQQQNKYLYPSDLQLVLNVITGLDALKSSEFLSYPICLPNYNSNCVMNAYMSHLDDQLCLVFLTGSCDHEQIMRLNDLKCKIKEDLCASSALLRAIHTRLNESEKALQLIDTSELKHFIFKDRLLFQYFSSDLQAPYNLLTSAKDQQRLFSNYSSLYYKLHRSFNSLRFVYICQKYETIVGLQTNEYEIYATFSPLVTKERVLNAADKLIDFIRKNKSKFFICTMPKLAFK